MSPGPEVPQPSASRMVPVSGHPIVVGVMPGQPELVALTAAAWATAAKASWLYFAYVDPTRVATEELADGTVLHQSVDPDGDDDTWQDRQLQIEQFLGGVMAGSEVPWRFRYLAGRPDRALTHLARTIDASAYVIGTRASGAGGRLRQLLDGSVAAHLSHHQHRPVLVVPLEVVDWQAATWWTSR